MFIGTDEGYVSAVYPDGIDNEFKFQYVYNHTDHLGNIRQNITRENGRLTVLREHNYYPFGLLHKGYNEEKEDLKYDKEQDFIFTVQAQAGRYKYRYNGKEWQDDLGLNRYDYGARSYDAAVGRWFVVDPLAEKYYGMTPYNYTGNNPVLFIDQDGITSESIHLDKYGNVLKNVNDGDNNVYVHYNAKTEANIDKNYSKENTSADGIRIGEIGGVLDINQIYSNLLEKDVKEAKKIFNPYTFVKYVENHGKWDLKNNKNTIYGLANDGKTQFVFHGKIMESQDIGNHHFGVVALAYGLFPSEEFILRKAGEYQMKMGTSKPEWQIYERKFYYDYSNYFGGMPKPKKVMLPPYGDDPRDQYWIKQGFKYFKKYYSND